MAKDTVAEELLKQTRMQARVAKKAASIQNDVALFQPLQPFVKRKGDRSIIWGIAGAIRNAVDRPGVAPTTKPKASDGAESFHFSLTTITKTSPFTRLITGEKEGAAAAHESYIEREDAPELYEKAALRRLETLGLADDLEIAIGGQAYIERKGAVEEAERGDHGLSMYGTLPEDYAERLKFWQEVEKSEREPRHHTLSVDPAKNPSLWAKIAADPAAPSELALAEASPERRLKVAEARAHAVHAYLAATVPPKAKPVATFTPGRGGHVQSRLIISLPYELSASDRAELVKSLCDQLFRNLDTKTESGRTTKVDVPFWSVVHKPEATSDDRNYHAHIVFWERPASIITDPASGQRVWDFACSETKRDAHRKTRTRFPFVQPKVRALNAANWPRLARHAYADLANEMLQARGIDKKLDPRRYDVMGISHEPVRRLKPNEYAKEKKGQATKGGEATTNAQWDRIVDNLDQRFPIAGFRPPPWIENRFDSEIRRWKAHDHPAGHALESAKTRWRLASFNARLNRAEAAAAAVVVEKIRSRLDAPGKSWVPKYPAIGEFLASVTDYYVTKPRKRALEHETTKREMEKYLSDLATARGPVIGNPLSDMLHASVPSVHPHKIKMVDGLAALSQQIIGMIDAGHDVDISAMHRQARADAGLILNADSPPPRQPAPQVTPAPKPVAAAPAVAKPPPTLPKLPPGAKTPFKSTAGRLLVNVDTLRLRARLLKRAADQQVADIEWQIKDHDERQARIAANRKDTVPRVTTSMLIDDRPIAPTPTKPIRATPINPTPPPSLPITRSKTPISVKPLQAPVRPAAQAAPPAASSAAQTPPAAAKPAPVLASQPKPVPSPAPAVPTPVAAPAAPARPAPEPSPAMPTRVRRAASPSEPSPTPPSSDRVPPPSEAPQKAAAVIDPKVEPKTPAPPPEPEPDEKALEHRKKRRRAIHARFGKSQGITR